VVSEVVPLSEVPEVSVSPAATEPPKRKRGRPKSVNGPKTAAQYQSDYRARKRAAKPKLQPPATDNQKDWEKYLVSIGFSEWKGCAFDGAPANSRFLITGGMGRDEIAELQERDAPYCDLQQWLIQHSSDEDLDDEGELS
jgi:hypothetical protein